VIKVYSVTFSCICECEKEQRLSSLVITRSSKELAQIPVKSSCYGHKTLVISRKNNKKPKNRLYNKEK
jgi:hypothetical protein